MAQWHREEKTVTTVRYVVPAPWPRGSAWDQLAQALDSARTEYRNENDGEPPSADSIRIVPEDDQIVISFEKKEAAARPAPWGAAAHS